MADILAENIAFDEDGLYIPQTWLDGIGEGNYTPVTADRMNHIEQGIKGLSDAWDSQSQPKLKIAYATVYIPCYMFAKTRVTAPIFEGYRFVTWLGAGGEGFAVALSFWDMASSSTDVFIAGTTATDGQTRRMWVHALYEKI